MSNTNDAEIKHIATENGAMTGTGRADSQKSFITKLLAIALFSGMMNGCSLDSLLKNDELPPGVTDPALTKTPQGALAVYQGAIARFQGIFGGAGGGVSFTEGTGILSDEIEFVGFFNPVDGRFMEPSGNFSSQSYSGLQQVRAQAGQAVHLLALYLPELPALAGHAYATTGYAEVMLAEFFCSGVPLSTIDFDQDYTLKSGSATAEILAHAIAQFDTASLLVSDSARLMHLAAIGKARALLGTGDYSAAAAAVANVPDGYRYEIGYSGNVPAAGQPDPRNFIYENVNFLKSVSDREGLNGLDYRSSGDPRTSVTLRGTTSFGWPIYRPTKYAADGSSPIVLASGVEARLIEAEAVLQADPDGGIWLAKLNALRTDGTFDTTATMPPDTLWHPGSGGVAGLGPLMDPGTIVGRVDLLFRERAFWLFLTGHRQGDMRRLIRQYGRPSYEVYPTGVYLTGFYPGFDNGDVYGDDVAAPVPEEERILNPLYTGCSTNEA